MKKQYQGLVAGHLERVASAAFHDFHTEITELAGRKHGVYALYRKDHLYYIGLARNLRNRLKHHLKDRHSGKWDRFSLFLIHDVAYLRELESLLVRIAEPKGNKQVGRFPHSENLRPHLKKLVETSQSLKLNELLGWPGKEARRGHSQPKKLRKLSPAEITLTHIIPAGTVLIGVYKGRKLRAKITKDGQVLSGGNSFSSLSMAAMSYVKRAANGWVFWKYKRSDGRVGKVDELRQAYLSRTGKSH